ncbi:MAG: lactate utilization protein B [Thermoguttaceae bacterium]
MPHDDSHLEGAEFLNRNTVGLYEPHGSKSLGESADRAAKHNRQIIASIPYFQEWREAANRIKAFAIANLDRLLVEFERNIAARGAEVLYAESAEEANRHVLRIAKENNVKSVVKAKSMVSEELELNHVLAAEGIRAVETDLGEYLVQLAEQRPVHIVTPALHMSASDVGHLFQQKLQEPYTAEHQALTATARKHLRQDFIRADMGVSGANFAIADTGTICVVENEGNAGLSTSAPPVHVVLMGIEKVIPSIQHLPVFLNLLARSGTGQKLTTYTHLFHGATPGRKLYVIILDNGRTNILKDPAARMSLFCIRCGACLNACPVYRRATPWAYGWVYPGPIGSIISPHLVGMKAAELPFASSLCGACGEVCPVKIDIPHQLVHLRHRAVNEPSPMNSITERITWKLWAWAMTSPLLYSWTMTGVKLGVRMARFLPWHPGKLGAWTRGRELPAVPKRSAFRTWWKRHSAEIQTRTENPAQTRDTQ